MSYYNQQQPPVGVPPPQGYPPEGYPKDSYPPPGYPTAVYPPQYTPPPQQQEQESSGFLERMSLICHFVCAWQNQPKQTLAFLGRLASVWLLCVAVVFSMPASRVKSFAVD
ncbi:hypothetical protein SAY86_011974 [Trapa natans]|uniref:Rhodopsin n=1 Tax=Trapa natans TaxID=22666 RepID=A0AAN7LWG7_TRANT|nr:hypothetical protein SAY86_011974 [Trapa natans]